MKEKDIENIVETIKMYMEETDAVNMPLCPTDIECTCFPADCKTYREQINICCKCWESRLKGER